MHDIKKRLIEEGWGKKEIDKTIKIIEKARANKHPKIKALDKVVVWLSFIIAVLGNFIVSVSMIPFLALLDRPMLYFIVVVVGLAFGLLIELLIRSIWHFESKHHILFLTIVPLIAAINFALINTVSNNLSKIFGIQSVQITQNLIIVGILYAIAFALPYLAYRLFIKK